MLRHQVPSVLHGMPAWPRSSYYKEMLFKSHDRPGLNNNAQSPIEVSAGLGYSKPTIFQMLSVSQSWSILLQVEDAHPQASSGLNGVLPHHPGPTTGEGCCGNSVF